MQGTSLRKDLSLKWLELFEIAARKGSLGEVSKESGLSVSTISHHLRNLEGQLGIELFNHTRRPMVLTPKGHVFLRNIRPALQAIRKAQAEASAGSIADASFLRIGTVEDFDSDISPDLAVFLSSRMPACEFLYHSDSSHNIIEMLRNRRLDLGIAGSPFERLRDLRDRPLLRDPFVVVLPRGTDHPVEEVVRGQSPLPFLSFSGTLIVARQIEAHLRRSGLSTTSAFECNNTQTLMAMVAAGVGWSITTPLLYSRAKRFQQSVRLHRFPGKGFARTLSILATPDCSGSVVRLVEQRVRASIDAHTLAPIHDHMPWLKDSFRLIVAGD